MTVPPVGYGAAMAPERDDEGIWQPTPSQAEGDRQPAPADEAADWQPIPQQPAEGGREAVDETVEDQGT